MPTFARVIPRFRGALPPRHGIDLTIRLAHNASALPSSSLPVPRPDYTAVLADPEGVFTNLKNRRSPTSLPPKELVEQIGKLYGQVSALQGRFQALRSERNNLGKILGNKSKETTEEARSEAKARAEKIRDELAGDSGVEKQLEISQDDLLRLGLQLPNSTSSSAPIGGYEACEVVKTSNGQAVQAIEKPNPAADHVALLTSLGWLYMPVHITGSSWPYLLRGGALLENALVQYALAKATSQGYEAVIPPDVVKHEIMKRCGFNPRDSGGEAQTYFVTTSTGGGSQQEAEEPELALAATSEIPLAGYFLNTLYKSPSTELPKKLVAIGHAFRAEAGSRGKESRGLYRVHQFTKLELFAVTTSEEGESSKILDEMTALQWSILEGLDLPLRLLNMSSEELGGSAFKKYDIEAYMPGRETWGELASASNCTDYQARRLDIRYRPAAGNSDDGLESASAEKRPSTAFCHTLNATAAAIPRLIVALIENGARFDENGTWLAMELPRVLRQYWMGKEAGSDVSVLPLVDVKQEKGKRKKPETIELKWI